MNSPSADSSSSDLSKASVNPMPWMSVGSGAVRAAFGVMMAVDAYLKWQPGFADHYVGYLQNASRAQPGWLEPWFNGWLLLVQGHVAAFVTATRLIESALALGLLLGFARRLTYWGGALFSLLIWSTAEGFGGPYTAGATNIGPALIYMLLFVSLAIFARVLGGTPYSLDYHIERRFPRWGRWMEPGRGGGARILPPVLKPAHQIAAAAALALALVFALGSLRSALQAQPPTPANAAAAVTPMSLYTGNPVRKPYPAELPPLLGTGERVAATLTVTDATIEIAEGVQYQA
ncbi:MAG: multicopper oxidase domain-containing protein, partial [Opitutaceae bacterium]